MWLITIGPKGCGDCLNMDGISSNSIVNLYMNGDLCTITAFPDEISEFKGALTGWCAVHRRAPPSRLEYVPEQAIFIIPAIG
jgi:hypothetical protein